MMGAGRRNLLLLCMAASLLSGCTHPESHSPLADALLAGMSSAKAEEAESERESREMLKTLLEIPGMKDEQTDSLLGDGEENWTEDRKLYIGRAYQAELFGEECRILTSCSNDRTVEAVSVWIINGEREIGEEETEIWTERLSDMMNAEPVCRYQLLEYQTLESGARSWKWVRDDRSVSMYQRKDVLTVSIQRADGVLG